VRKIGALRVIVLSDEIGGGGWELCATANVEYDTASSTVVIELDSRVQPVGLPAGMDGVRQPWLPAQEVVKRRVPLREARTVANDVFRRWATKVRRTIPAPAHHSAD